MKDGKEHCRKFVLPHRKRRDIANAASHIALCLLLSGAVKAHAAPLSVAGVYAAKSHDHAMPASAASSRDHATGLTSVIATLGPEGFQIDPVTGTVTSSSGNQYRAIYFNISVSPILTPILKEGSSEVIASVGNRSQDLKMMDVMIRLLPLGVEGDYLSLSSPPSSDARRLKQQIIELEADHFPVIVTTDSTGTRCWAKTHKILRSTDLTELLELLAMMPNRTSATTEDADAVKAVKLLEPAGNVIAGIGLGGLVGAAGPKLVSTSGGLTTIFSNLIPPKSVPTQYAFQESPRDFGWYFRQYTRNAATASILGTHLGAAILSMRSEVKAVGIYSNVLATWRKPLKNASHHNISTFSQVLTLPVKSSAAPAVDNLVNEALSKYSVLIGRSKVLQILSVTGSTPMTDVQLQALVRTTANPNGPLVAAYADGPITKDSLLIFLGLKPDPKLTGAGGSRNANASNSVVTILNTGQGTSLVP